MPTRADHEGGDRDVDQHAEQPPAVRPLTGDRRPTEREHAIPPRHVRMLEQPLHDKGGDDHSKPRRACADRDKTASIAALPAQRNSDGGGQDAEWREAKDLSVYE